MIDGGLWAEIKKHMGAHALTETGHRIHWTRVETGSTLLGVPDVNLCYRGREVWLELKATEAWAVRMRPEQIGWATLRTRAGGRVWLLTRRQFAGGPRRESCDELWIHRGADVAEVAQLGLKDGPPPELVCTGGPENWLWPAVHELILED